ncbi:hypothetical protein FF38_05645 [Lucilia cuprina]|uniref:Uncharacterized protein n=1 Tax=Lucilia cuprina TaxID=7375 RepID=A0A0L0C0H0_LUCCU|nr:hypothetical protein FF38_05645 [Lucilia cuprina]
MDIPLGPITLDSLATLMGLRIMEFPTLKKGHCVVIYDNKYIGDIAELRKLGRTTDIGPPGNITPRLWNEIDLVSGVVLYDDNYTGDAAELPKLARTTDIGPPGRNLKDIKDDFQGCFTPMDDFQGCFTPMGKWIDSRKTIALQSGVVDMFCQMHDRFGFVAYIYLSRPLQLKYRYSPRLWNEIDLVSGGFD